MIGAMIVRFARHDRVAGALLVPYAMWVTFAMALNAALWHLNS
jgi:tryptophan-rich sensory protein